jgi:hypothetical protein
MEFFDSTGPVLQDGRKENVGTVKEKRNEASKKRITDVGILL